MFPTCPQFWGILYIFQRSIVPDTGVLAAALPILSNIGDDR